MRILLLTFCSFFALFTCESSRTQPEAPILVYEAEIFGKWEQVVALVDTSLIPISELHRNETYIFSEDFTYDIINPRKFANAVEGEFEINLENNRVDLIPFTEVPIILNGDSVDINLEIKPWYWEIVDLFNDTLTIKEYDRTGRVIIDGDTHVFVKTE